MDAFVSRYGSSRHRAEIDGLRDEAAWQRTNRGDENSLGAYLSSFPEGKHAKEAKGKLGELRDEAAWQRTNRDDENGLYTYLKAFPGGKYSEVASELVAKIHAPPVVRRSQVPARFPAPLYFQVPMPPIALPMPRPV